MTITNRSTFSTPPTTLSYRLVSTAILVGLTLLAGVIGLQLGTTFRDLPDDSELLTDSTAYELAVWVADQSAEEAPPSLLGSLAKNWALANGQDALDEEVAITTAQNSVFVWGGVIALTSLISIVGILLQADWQRIPILFTLVFLSLWLMLYPTIDGDNSIPLVLGGMLALIIAFILAKGIATQTMNFLMALCLVLFVWETLKILAHSINYAISVPQASWVVTTYPDLDSALNALTTGDISAVFADGKDLEELMPTYPEEGNLEGFTYADLRAVTLNSEEATLIFPIMPEVPGRLGVALPTSTASQIRKASQLVGETVGAVKDEFADTKFLALPRRMTLLDLRILNDLNLPHLQAIAEAFLQPARRNGELLLARILGEAALYTWSEAVIGFVFGALFGLILGTIFAHSRLLERALLPYVVASQTVPILAFAPIVIIWLGASPTSVAIIAIYITFFPVTINTLRGLQSPNPTAVELMDSYAANRWTTLWKLRFPSALPYIFAALKVSATASVVGAIIGELPSSIGDGLARAILDFGSDYSAISTPKLWASIITAAMVGVTFFVIVSVIERLVLRRYVRSDGL